MFQYTGKDPEDLEDWSHAKRLDYERKKLIKIMDFFNLKRSQLKEESKSETEESTNFL